MYTLIISGLMAILSNLGADTEYPTLNCKLVSGRHEVAPAPYDQQVEWLLKSESDNNLELLGRMNLRISSSTMQDENIPLIGPCDVLTLNNITLAIGHYNGIPLIRIMRIKQVQYRMVGGVFAQNTGTAR